MKRDVLRTAVLLLINGFQSWWLIRLTLEEHSILSSRHIAVVCGAILLLVTGIVLDWLSPSWGCTWNIAIWSLATVFQIWVAVHARLARQYGGVSFTASTTLFVCFLYVLSWRDARRKRA